MRAFVIDEFGKSGSVQVVPHPQVGDGEILVRVHAASVNPMDAYVVSGGTRQYADTRLPLIPGLDAAGIIEAVGQNSNGFAPGDEVVATAATKPFWGAGTFAELVSVPASAVTHKPAGLDDATAAAVPQVALTAVAALDALDLQSSDVVIVAGATGGVGSFFTQLAHERGATVVALVRPQNAEYARSLGANDVIDYAAGDLVERLRDSFPDGIDAVADFAGDSELLEKLSGVLRPGGRLTSSAAMLDIEAYAARGITAAPANRADPARLREIVDLLEKDKLRAPEVQVRPLAQAAEALDEAAKRHTRGKVVLSIR